MFMPTVSVRKLVAQGNKVVLSPSSSSSMLPCGIIQVQACSAFNITESEFLSNENLFFVVNNATSLETSSLKKVMSDS